jgi:hypothetical protein
MTATDALLAVDEALQSGRPDARDPVERELQELALALRAEAPEPDPGFVRELDDRVAVRFARPRVARSLLPRRRLLLAGAASLVVAIAIGGAVVGLAGRHGGAGGGPTAQVATSEVKRGPGPQAAGAAAGPDSALSRDRTVPLSRRSPAAGRRRVERSAELTLAAPADRLDDVANDVVRVTDRHRGIVLDSSLATGSDPSRGGSFTLRVPSRELSQTLRDLSRLGQVRSRSQSGHDVTRSYDSLADRLLAARVERRGLLRRLGHATSTGEADRLRSRIDTLSAEIQQLRTEVGRLETRTDYTRIAVTLVERREPAGAAGGAGRALHGSLRALTGAVGVILVALAAVLPFALLGALAWGVAAALRRRRREAVLS